MIFHGLANVVVPPSFKRFPEEIHTLRLRSLCGHQLRELAQRLQVPSPPDSCGQASGFPGGYNIDSLYAVGWRDTRARVRGLTPCDVENDVADSWSACCTLDLSKLERVRGARPKSGRRVPPQRPVHADFPDSGHVLGGFGPVRIARLDEVGFGEVDVLLGPASTRRQREELISSSFCWSIRTT